VKAGISISTKRKRRYNNELQRRSPFGIVRGDAGEKPVLLIKLAWGANSRATDFRPPGSAGDVGRY
jgi:hypothetical protein